MTKKLEWMDNMRAIATISVIIVHVVYGVVSQNFQHNNMPYFWIGNIIDSALRFCVPIFLMLSGASLLGKDSTYLDFIKKRFMRIFFPFLFWSILYVFYAFYMSPLGEKPTNMNAFWTWLSKLFWEKNISMHFWYLYTILIIYSFVPFLGRWVRSLSEKKLLNYIIVWVFFCIVITLGSEQIKLPHLIARVLNYTAYTGYLVLGYYLSIKNFKSFRTKYIAIIGFVLSVGATAILVYIQSKTNNKLDLSSYGYYWINSIIQSACIFIVIKEMNTSNKLINKVFSIISNYSFGIYLVHVMILGFFYLLRIYWTMAHPLISVPTITILCLIVSFLSIYLLRKIPGGKYISG